MRNSKLLSFVVTLCMVIGLIPGLPVKAEISSASYTAGMESDLIENMQIQMDYRTIVEKDGKPALVRTPDIEEGLYIYLKLPDDFTNWEGQPVNITVEYFDEGSGSFTFSYSGPNDRPDLYDHSHTNAHDIVFMENSMEWKTHTFYIEDCRFAHNYVGGNDMRFALWSDEMERSTDDIYIHSIKIEKTAKKEVSLGAFYSEYMGNIFGPGEDKILSVDIENRKEYPMNGTASYIVTDFDENEILRNTLNFGLLAEGSSTLNINVNDINKFGVYRINMDFSFSWTENGENKTVEDVQEGDFSYVNKPKEKNPLMNVQTHGTWHGEEASAIAADWAGFDSVRDEIRWRYVEQSKGDLSIPEDNSFYLDFLQQKDVGFYTILAFGNPLYHGVGTEQMIPPVDEESLNGWERYCEFIASSYPDYLKEFEVWNEYNITAFNQLLYEGGTPENYVEMAKRASRAIKKYIPDAKIFGGGLAGADSDYLRRLLNAGLYDYVDGFSCHPYDWSGSFRNQSFIDDMNHFKSTIQEFGPIKPIYMTELGINDGTGVDTGVSTYEKACMIIQAYSMMVGENLADKWFWYDLIKSSYNTVDQESNFGLIKAQSGITGTASYAATPAYAVIAGMNSMLTGAEADGKIEYEDREMRAYNFRTKEGDNIATAWSTKGKRTIHLNLGAGCKEVLVYDMYSNLIGKVKSDDGVFAFNVDNDPIYIRGNFTAFERAQAEEMFFSDFENYSAGTKITHTQGVDGWLMAGNSEGEIEIADDYGNKVVKIKKSNVSDAGAQAGRFEKSLSSPVSTGTVRYSYRIKVSSNTKSTVFCKGSSGGEYCTAYYNTQGQFAKIGKYPAWDNGLNLVHASGDTYGFYPGKWYSVSGTVDLDNDIASIRVSDESTIGQMVAYDFNHDFQTLQFVSGWEDGAEIYVDDIYVGYDSKSAGQIKNFVDIPFSENFEDEKTLQTNWDIYSYGMAGNPGGPDVTNTEPAEIRDENGNKVFYLGLAKDTSDHTGAKVSLKEPVSDGKLKVSFDIKPSSGLSTHIYFSGTREGGEKGVSAMSLFYFENGKIRALSNGSGNGFEIGDYTSDTWYHCSAEADLDSGMVTVWVNKKGEENEEPQTASYQMFKNMKFIEIDGFILQEWGAKENSGSYFDNIELEYGQEAQYISDRFLVKDNFDSYRDITSCQNVGWQIIEGVKANQSSVNQNPPTIMDGKQGNGLYLGMSSNIDNVVAKRMLSTVLRSGKVRAVFDLKPDPGIETHVFFGSGNSFATALFFSKDCKIVVGNNAAGSNNQDRIIGEYTPGSWLHCEVTADLDTDRVSAKVTSENGIVMTAEDFTIRDMNFTYFDTFKFQIWGASYNAGTLFDNLLVYTIPSSPVISDDKVSFIKDGKVLSGKDNISPSSDKIQLDFGSEMDLTTLSGLEISSQNETLRYTLSTEGKKVLINLKTPLKQNTQYSISIPPEAKNTAGETLGENKIIVFGTGEGELEGTVSVSSKDAEPLTDFSKFLEDGEMQINVSLNNASLKDQQSMIICAFYDKQGALLRVLTETLDVSPAQSLEKSITVTAGSAQNAASAKVMLWNGLEKMKPMDNVWELSN